MDVVEDISASAICVVSDMDDPFVKIQMLKAPAAEILDPVAVISDIIRFIMPVRHLPARAFQVMDRFHLCYVVTEQMVTEQADRHRDLFEPRAAIENIIIIFGSFRENQFLNPCAVLEGT